MHTLSGSVVSLSLQPETWKELQKLTSFARLVFETQKVLLLLGRRSALVSFCPSTGVSTSNIYTPTDPLDVAKV